MKSIAVFENIADRIYEELDNAQETILIAVAWFTNKELFRKLLEKAENGCKIELILVDDDINKSANIKFDILKKYKTKIYKIPESEKEIMHNKFCIIDNSTVITGSYNWSYKAERNFENILITYKNQTLANQYKKEFRKISKTINVIQLRKKPISQKQLRDRRIFNSLNKQLTDLIHERNTLEEKLFIFSKLFDEDLYEPLKKIIESNQLKIFKSDSFTKYLNVISELNSLIQPYSKNDLRRQELNLNWQKIRSKPPNELKDYFLNLKQIIKLVKSFNDIKNDHNINFIFDEEKASLYIYLTRSLLQMTTFELMNSNAP